MQLHIVSFDIPFPPNYGGVIDIFYKLKALSKQGVKINLHCFEYNRPPVKELEKYCSRVHYYKRDTAKSQLFHRLPYIVVSRSSQQLIKNLLEDDAPVLFEGLHSCYFLNDERLKNRMRIVRTHNVEHDYYQSLARVESDIFKRYYFFNESEKLKVFENVLEHASHIAAISPNDKAYFKRKFGNAVYLPAFHSNEKVRSQTGSGTYALYHGNLSIGENHQAALFLVQEVFNELEHPLVIAGNKPAKELRDAINKSHNIKLMADISTEEINRLISESHINVLPTFQPTGIKLKLLTALFNGRHALVNTTMVENTGLEKLCHIADSRNEFRKKIKALFKKEFATHDLEKRKKILFENFSNETNAGILLNLLNGK